jgi:peptide/nickel transport system ATP-binding protein
VLLCVQKLKVFYSTKRGPVRAVDGVDFTLGRGVTLGIAGESGCGKSTLGLSLVKLGPKNCVIEGKILFKDTDLVGLSERQMQRKVRGKEIAVVFQDPMTSLDPVFTVRKQLIETYQAHFPMSNGEAQQESIRLLDAVGIPLAKFSTYPFSLSGGLRQRVVTAISLAPRPSLIIADEPTTALDVTIQAQILRLFKWIKEEYETAFILITHDLGIIRELCDRVAVMYAGKIVEYGPSDDIFDCPRHPYTEDLLNSLPQRNRRGCKLYNIGGSPPDLIAPPSGCRYHPRCRIAEAVCREKEPLLEITAAHDAACHFRKVPEDGGP